ncbi:MAG: hypothetical protein IPM21_11970 [Acidobacteria bacterium]|nr:hypothetical protein [Acidobacteriota bacterium]
MRPQATKTLIMILALAAMLVPSVAGQDDYYSENALYSDSGSDEPIVTDRVARISDIRGEARVRREGTEEWEVAVLNLPLVEGDELVTNSDGRVEIQFGLNKFVRLSFDSQLRIVTLKDEGIALSVPQGTASATLLEFDAQQTFFEIDAPRMTLAAQTSGTYRVDSGRPGDIDVRVSTGETGEARIYSSTSGFTLRSGRSARVIIDGRSAGDWENLDYAGVSDEFDRWVVERDSAISRRLQNAHYGTYYDRDIYGADELDSYGDWEYTQDYGYMWRPYSSTISSYNDWSPYRYGHWRWMSSYGWVWVNDEPWGWATYHHGRWVWHRGRWYWSPYSSYRGGRSWWRPALVVLTQRNGNYCWYPLPYQYPYYDYNRRYYGNRRRGRNPRPSTPNPTQPTQPVPSGQSNAERMARLRTPPFQRVPAGSVVTVPGKDFGREPRAGQRPPLADAREILTKSPFENKTPPNMPDIGSIDRKPGRGILTEKPVIAKREVPVATGAETRKPNAPLDRELKDRRMLGGRPPLVTTPVPAERTPPQTTAEPRRRTGAFDRSVPRVEPQVTSKPPERTPTYIPRPTPRQTSPDRKPEPPVERNTRPSPPFNPQPRPQPQPPRTETPRRAEPPVRRETPAPRPAPAPRPSPPPRRETPKPAPPKSESKPEPRKPSPPLASERKGKDGE